MRIPYDFEKCIICLSQPCGDWEHILPDYIGGRLQGRMLCNSCNHTFGQTLVSNLKYDASIRLAMEALKDQIPALYTRAQQKAVFVGKAADSSVIRASVTKTGMKILPGPGANDSRILDTIQAADALKTKLVRHGISPEEAVKWQAKFLQLEEDDPLQIPTGETFVKRRTPPLQPELGATRADGRLMALVAFEFLSLLIGKLIHRTSFHPVRQYIRDGDETGVVTIEHFAAGKKYDAFHAIAVAPIEGAIRVDIRLFRWLTSRVTFHGFDYRGLDSVYFEDLKSPRSLFAPTREDARNGNWFTTEKS